MFICTYNIAVISLPKIEVRMCVSKLTISIKRLPSQFLGSYVC